MSKPKFTYTLEVKRIVARCAFSQTSEKHIKRLALLTRFKDLLMDDIDFVEMIMDVEKEFDISITDSEALKLKTIGQLIDVIKRKRKRV